MAPRLVIAAVVTAVNYIVEYPIIPPPLPLPPNWVDPFLIDPNRVARKKLEEEENPENFNIPLPVVICYFDAQLTRTKNKLSTLLTTLS